MHNKNMNRTMGTSALKPEDLPHYTYDDYAQWEGRWEIIRGIPYAMVPAPRYKHQRLSVTIATQLERLLTDCRRCRALMPMDWQITEETVVQPDVLVICEDNIEQMDGTKLTAPPVLIFEILSPSTLRKDRVIKYQLYQDAGVKYYCLVDPDTHSAEVYRLNGDAYEPADTFKDGKITFDLGPCSIAFDFNDVFNY